MELVIAYVVTCNGLDTAYMRMTVYCIFLCCQVRKLGPGSYEIKDFLETSDLKPRSALGICETRATRFKEHISETPGPGKLDTPFHSCANTFPYCLNTKFDLSGSWSKLCEGSILSYDKTKWDFTVATYMGLDLGFSLFAILQKVLVHQYLK